MIVIDSAEPQYILDIFKKRDIPFKVEGLSVTFRNCNLLPLIDPDDGHLFCASQEEFKDMFFIQNWGMDTEECDHCKKKEIIRVGDFTNKKRSFIIERKRMDDLWNSLCSYRLYKQLQKMDECFSGQKYLLIEGVQYFQDAENPFDEFNKELIDLNAFSPLQRLVKMYEKEEWIYSIIKECASRDITVIQTGDAEETVEFVWQINEGAGKEPKIRATKKPLPKLTLEENILTCIPRIGVKRAAELYKILKTGTKKEIEDNKIFKKMRELFSYENRI